MFCFVWGLGIGRRRPWSACLEFCVFIHTHHGTHTQLNTTGAHLRFFRHITVAAKVPYIVDLAKKAIEGAPLP